MWWQFYTGLSVKVIDHLLDYVAEAPAVETAQALPAPVAASPHISRMLTEINEEMTAISELQRKSIREEMAAHARTLCLNEISHDLRTPLNAIIGFTQLMESGIFGSINNNQYHEYLRHIRESGYELLERIEELLNTTADSDSPKPVNPAPGSPAPAYREFAA